MNWSEECEVLEASGEDVPFLEVASEKPNKDDERMTLALEG